MTAAATNRPPAGAACPAETGRRGGWRAPPNVRTFTDPWERRSGCNYFASCGPAAVVAGTRQDDRQAAGAVAGTRWPRRDQWARALREAPPAGLAAVVERPIQPTDAGVTVTSCGSKASMAVMRLLLSRCRTWPRSTCQRRGRVGRARRPAPHAEPDASFEGLLEGARLRRALRGWSRHRGDAQGRTMLSIGSCRRS